MDNGYMSRGELVSYLSEHFKVSEIPGIIKYIEGCMVLSATDNSDVFVLEISDRCSQEQVTELADYFFEKVSVPVLFVSADVLKYKGKVNAASMGITERIKTLKRKLKEVLNG